MKQYEVTFIVDPVLSGDEIKSTAQTYVQMLEQEGSKIVHIEESGLKPLAYPLNKRSTGVYYTIEFNCEQGTHLAKVELALKRDERIMRFLTVKLDKYAVKFNEDKRAGKFAKKAGGPKVPPVEAFIPVAPAVIIPEAIAIEEE